MIYTVSIMSRASEAVRTAKLFKNGRSQAVRLPMEFRLPGSEVRIRRSGRAVVLEPIASTGWPKAYFSDLRRLRKGLDLAAFLRPPDAPPRPASAIDLDE